MKKQLRDLASFFVLLLLLLLLAGCGQEASESTSPEMVVGHDPAAELLEILEIPDRFERIERLIANLRAIPAGQIEAVATVLQDVNVKKPSRDFERILLVSGWARVDPASATRWVMAKERQDYLRKTMFTETVYAWALEDPESVRSDFKVGMYSVRGWNPTMLRALVRGWHDSGEPELEAFIRDLGRSGDDQQRAISELIEVKLENETPDAMIAWVMELGGSKRYRSYAYSRLAADIAAIDPKRAIAWCDEICDSDVGEDLPHWISSSWVRKDGLGAMNWIIAQPETTSVRVGIRSSYRRFQKTSPEEADAWLEKFSEEDRAGALLQGPVVMYVNRQSQLANDEVAIEWTQYIENDWEVERSLTSIARRWLRRDEEPAKLWLSGNEELSDDAKTDLLDDHKRYKEKAAKMRARRESRPDWIDDLDQ
jgi:hypothetical protein